MEIQLWVPDQAWLQNSFQLQGDNSIFPYWAKLWPAALVLSRFILDNPAFIENKKVLELAGGLGLPSLFASSMASSVICSDYDATAVAFIRDNIALNHIGNMESRIINWTNLTSDINFDVLLLSDINYNPEDFAGLIKMIEQLLSKGITILLSTPQRLAGREFIEQLLPYCKRNDEIWQDQTAINVLVLKN